MTGNSKKRKWLKHYRRASYRTGFTRLTNEVYHIYSNPDKTEPLLIFYKVRT
ncbi:unnamed protein product [marine sediment metagenome]|uniref:Uncharacterized protein n=1 Tax=marine sediment metagenome TaxID=412755 RepID=X0VR36_9ZZZZ